MLWSMAITRSTVVLVPEVSNAAPWPFPWPHVTLPLCIPFCSQSSFRAQVIAALVASCACCNAINPVVAMFVGFVGAILALACDALLVRLQIDDPVGAVAAHGPPGVWGTVAVAFFAEPNCQSDVQGLLYGASTAGWQLLAVQILGVVALSAACQARCNSLASSL